MFRACFVVLLLAAPALVSAAEDVHILNLELWSRPREGDVLVTYPGLGAAVREWSETASGVLEIRYPGGEEGSVWAEELRDWLIALGVPSRNVTTVPGSASPDVIELVVVSPGGP